MSSVLLVDDEPGVLFTLSELLTERGHRVIGAKSGDDALRKLDEADAVLTDLSMPGMDGLELVKQIRRQHPSVHVIVLTGFPRSADIGDFLAQGVDDFLPKPFRANDLMAVIRRLEQKIAASGGSSGPRPAGG